MTMSTKCKVIGNQRSSNDDLEELDSSNQIVGMVYVCTLGSRLEMYWSLGRRMIISES